jgi:hypothetical protein
MVLITCDNCGRRKLAREDWLLAFNVRTSALEKVRHSVIVDLAGLEVVRAEESVPSTERQSSRCSLVLNDRWDKRRILAKGAVHLCSLECKDEYLEYLGNAAKSKPDRRTRREARYRRGNLLLDNICWRCRSGTSGL